MSCIHLPTSENFIHDGSTSIDRFAEVPAIPLVRVPEFINRMLHQGPEWQLGDATQMPDALHGVLVDAPNGDACWFHVDLPRFHHIYLVKTTSGRR